MKSGKKCPVCDISELPSDDQWWLDNKSYRCRSCYSEIGLSGWQRFRLYGWDSMVGWGIGISIITVGLALVVTLPVYIFFSFMFANARQYKVIRRHGPVE